MARLLLRDQGRRFGIASGSLRDRFGIASGSLRDRFGFLII
jgi:hypothetical protein